MPIVYPQIQLANKTPPENQNTLRCSPAILFLNSIETIQFIFLGALSHDQSNSHDFKKLESPKKSFV